MIALLALMAAMQAGNETQWVTGRIQDRDPVASFLTWDFSSVILRATCKNGEVIVDYYGDNVVPRDAAKTALFVDGSAFEMRRTGVAEYAIDGGGSPPCKAVSRWSSMPPMRWTSLGISARRGR